FESILEPESLEEFEGSVKSESPVESKSSIEPEKPMELESSVEPETKIVPNYLFRRDFCLLLKVRVLVIQ
ncbi:1432_t:CDS:2, partial [Gigaspora rosea]